MRKVLLLLITFIGGYMSVYSQCTSSLTPTLCSDPANNVYFVDPTADVEIVFEDAIGTPITNIIWSPQTFLYLSPNQMNPLPGPFPNPLPSIYFNGGSHNDPANNPFPMGGAIVNSTYTYNYTLPGSAGCTPSNGQIQIVTGGFTYDDYCKDDTTTLDDLPLLNYNTVGGLNWYSDAAGTASIANTTVVEGGQTYYVDLGITGCSMIFPVVIEYGTPKPQADTIQNFCTQATWAAGGFSTPGDTVDDLVACGSSLTWYSDAAGTMPINNLSSIDLADGDTYYVSQTIGGCESALLAVNLLENECACIENSSIEGDNTSEVINGFDFYTTQIANGLKSCDVGNASYTSAANTYNPGSFPVNQPSQPFSVVTPGPISSAFTELSKTSPFGCSEYGFRINDYYLNASGVPAQQGGYADTAGTLVKEFIAGEILTFDFSLIFVDPNHSVDEQPALMIRLYDDAGNLVQNRCLVSDPDDCIFSDVPGTTNDILYSDWSCVKLNTIELQGQAARVELTVTDCPYSVDWATAFIDNFYIGDDVPGVCDNSAFGYMAVDPIVDANSGGYEACSLFNQPVDPNCAPALAITNPTFPIEVCGTYSNPLGGVPSTVEIEIVDGNGTSVYTPNTFTAPGGPGTFCVTINQGDIPTPYGSFTVDGEMIFDMNCGAPYQYDVQAQSNGFKFCPTAGCPSDFPFCDGVNAPNTLDLTTRTAAVLSNIPAANQGDYVVTYYDDQNNAFNQGTAIANSSAYPTPTVTETIYVRLDYDYTALGIAPVDDCYDIVAFDIIIGSEPNIPSPLPTLKLCDDDTDGVMTFNLTDNETTILSSEPNPVDFDVTYYANATDLANGNAIANETAYDNTTPNTQTIFVLVENISTGCTAEEQFDLVVDPLPTYNTPTDYSLCDDDGVEDGFTNFDFTVSTTQIEGANTNLAITYYDDSTEADGGLAADQLGSPYTNTTVDSQTIFVRIEDTTTGCYELEPLLLEVIEVPTATMPATYELCDTNGDNQEQFDLSTLDTTVNNDPNVTITYHATQNDADAGTPVLPTLYTSPSATIYIRVEDNAGAGCYNTTTVDLQVNEGANVPNPLPTLEVCDDDTDGIATFNLTDNEATILSNEPNPANFDVTYYANATDLANANAIATETAYDNATANTQTIYIAVENLTTGCITEAQFDITVNPLPTYNAPADYTLCDQGAQDGFTPFDFTVSTTQIEGINTNLTITYYETTAEADGGLVGDQLGSPYTNTTVDNQTVHVRIEDAATGCYVVEPLLLEVIPAPTVTAPAVYELCDSGTGQAQFDLSTLDAAVNNDPNVTITYHATQTAADAGTPVLPVLYNSATATIYARVEDNNPPGCYNTIAVDLQVNPNPDVPNALPTLELCDDDTDGIATFNLTDNEATILSNEPSPANFDVTYYANATDLANANAIATETAYDNTPPNTQTIFVLVENLTTGCTTEAQFDITVNPLPTYNAPADYSACDLGAQDGFTDFDFTVSTTQIEGVNTNLTITYYETSAEADGGLVGDQLGSPYTNTTVDNQTVHVRIEDAATGCYVVEPLLLEVIPAPTVTAPAVYELCDSGTGQAQFDLSTLNAAVNNDPNVTITYHATQTAADAGTPVLPVLYNSATATIYARVEDNNPPGCYNTIAVDLQVNPNPDVPNALPTLELCDDDTDGIATFNLTDNEATILSNEPSPANFDVTYYANATDLANANAIATETAYDNTTPNTQTIFVLVENLTTGCTTEAQFDITVNPLPSYNVPAPLIICDDASANGIATFTLSNATAQLTGSNPNLNVSYFPSQATAQAGDPNDELPNSYTNTNPFNETIWVRIYNINTQCFVVDSLDLQVDQAPQANTPQDFIYCDDDNDGVGQFILTDLDDEINNDPSVTITYHQTQANADNNVLPLSSPFTNTVNTTQTIYVRVESPGVDCYSTVTATLIVEDSPQPVLAADLDPLEACDDDNSGNAVFDLTQMEPAILANETTPSDFTVTYYQTQNDADNQTNPIGVPAAYTSNGLNQTIYVVVEGLNGCLGETSFELIVNPLPTVNPPSALELCDYNNPGDEQEAFNLNDATLEITGGDNSIDVTYYASQADADAGINPLSSPYTNTVNNETIYIRSVDQDTGCSVTQGYTLTLVVNPLPSPQVPVEPLLVCDADNDGFAEFDLDAQIPIITNGEVNVVVTYHITQANADAGSNPIDTTQPYGIVAGNGVQTIYVRATNSVTGCYVVEVLELEVVSTPEIGTLEDLFVCDDATADGFAIFDLTVNTTNVIGNQNPADVTVTYYETQADAAAGTNAIAVPSMYTNNMNPQRIFVRIENNATGCIDTFDTANDNSFWIEVEENPDVMDPTNLQLCDDDYATSPVPQNIFNLTVKEGEISGQNFPPSSYEFTYYANNVDYQAGTAIGDPTAYENQSNPQTIIVEVVDTTTEGMCASTVNLTIEVLPLPSPSEDDQDILRLEECDDDNDGIAAIGFDLTQSGDLISAGENVILTYYTTENAAEDGDTTAPEYIADPTNYTNDPSLNITNADGLSVQVIYVRIDSNVNGNFCFVVVSFEIDVVPAPVLNDMDPFGYILCEDGNTGTATIFLDDIAENVYDATLDFDTDPNTTADTSILVPLLDQTENEDLDITNYTVSYHFTQVGAETDTAEVPNGYQATDGERFFIRIEYKDTGCYNTNAIGEVVVTVEERPSIDDVDILEQLCSDEQGGDSVTIDLAQYNGQINPGSPANTQVVYYATMNDYMAGNAIDPSQLSTYTTVENPQTIIAEVIDTVTLCESELFATIEIEIGESPIIDISSYDGTVLCEDLDPNTPVVGGDYSSVTIDTGLSTTQYDFEWTQNGATLMETGSSLTVSEPGTYEVTVTDPLTGCASTSSATFASGNPPEFTVESTTFGFNGEHALLISNVIGAGDYEFSVDNGPWIALGAEGTLTLDGLSGGVHEVRGRDRNGCGITLNEVFFIDYPKFFTPNQDGYNDTWNIQGISNQLDAKIYIFDRYGKLLKQLSPSSPGWDGTYNGNLMPSNDYWFRVEYTDIDGTRKEFKANFTLKR